MLESAYNRFDGKREKMIERQLLSRGIHDERIIEAFNSVRREDFLTDREKELAYEDNPLPILCGQTISQPYIVAYMTEVLDLSNSPMRILEVGTGSGFQTAILAYMGHRIVSIERIHELSEFAEENLNDKSYRNNIKLITGDGSLGWKPDAPYDRVIVTAASPGIPEPLVDQLVTGGKIVIPCGDVFIQNLIVAEKLDDGKLEVKQTIACRFVPLLGEYGFVMSKESSKYGYVL